MSGIIYPERPHQASIYLVGGAVRNRLLGRECHDLDFAVEAPNYEYMRQALLDRGLHIWQERPEFVTLRGQIAVLDLGTFDGYVLSKSPVVNADFTLCRAEAQYSDRRHPDIVTPAPLHVDLSRRDFTCNAIAIAESGAVIDPYRGRDDIQLRRLTCVGEPVERFREDPLRILRAIRFAVTCGFKMDENIRSMLRTQYLCNMLGTLPHERVREELNKAFAADWQETMMTLAHDCPQVGLSLYRTQPKLWLKATTETR